MKNFTKLILIQLIFVSNSFSQNIGNFINKVNIDSLVSTVRILSGEDSTYILGVKTKITERYSDIGSNLAASYIKQRLMQYGLTVEEQDYSINGRNVIATQLGRENPDNYYIICAHYDSKVPFCADDNASSVAAVIETARILSGHCFKNTIIYALWDQEEIGHKGSQFYANQAYNSNMTIKGVINIEMLGYDGNNDGKFDIHITNFPNSNFIKDSLISVTNKNSLLLTPYVINPGTTASDHSSFWSKGYPAVCLSEAFFSGDPNPSYHTVNDRINLFNLSYFHKLSKLSVGIIANFAIPYFSVSNIFVTACESYNFNGHECYLSGVYKDTISSSANCDSIITLNLTLLNSTSTDIQYACDSYTWMNGVTYFENIDTAIWILPNYLGCDSIITLNLTLLNSTSTDIQYACDSLIWIDGITYFESNNFATFTIPNSYGCDSLVTLDLTILNSTYSSDVVSVCDSYTWINGVTYNESTNNQTYVMTNSIGCDSIISLDLTIHNSSFSNDFITSCDSILWLDGNVYSENNNSAIFITQNSFGCDSIINLNLTINKPNMTVNTWMNDNNAIISVSNNNESFQWLDCNNNFSIIPDETYFYFHAFNEGAYAVEVTSNGCTDTSGCIPVIFVNINENNLSNCIDLYCNNTEGFCEIDICDLREVTIKVFNIQSQLIYKKENINSSHYRFDLNSGSGIYIIEISSAEFIKYLKFIKN